MNRRDFTRLGLAMGLTPVAAQSTLAQMSAEELKKAPQAWMSPTVIVKQELPAHIQPGQRATRIFGRGSGDLPSIGRGAILGKPIAM